MGCSSWQGTPICSFIEYANVWLELSMDAPVYMRAAPPLVSGAIKPNRLKTRASRVDASSSCNTPAAPLPVAYPLLICPTVCKHARVPPLRYPRKFAESSLPHTYNSPAATSWLRSGLWHTHAQISPSGRSNSGGRRREAEAVRRELGGREAAHVLAPPVGPAHQPVRRVQYLQPGTVAPAAL